jgi:hypothetical protein
VKQVHIAKILDQGHAIAGALVDDGGHAQFRLLEKVADRDELLVVLPFFGPMNADEWHMNRRFHPHDRAAGGTALDRFKGDGNGRVHSEILSGGGKDRFGWHGRRQNRRENGCNAKGIPAESLMMIKPKQDEQCAADAPQEPLVGDEVGINHQSEPDHPGLPQIEFFAVGKRPDPDG